MAAMHKQLLADHNKVVAGHPSEDKKSWYDKVSGKSESTYAKPTHIKSTHTKLTYSNSTYAKSADPSLIAVPAILRNFTGGDKVIVTAEELKKIHRAHVKAVKTEEVYFARPVPFAPDKSKIKASSMYLSKDKPVAPPANIRVLSPVKDTKNPIWYVQPTAFSASHRYICIDTVSVPINSVIFHHETDPQWITFIHLKTRVPDFRRRIVASALKRKDDKAGITFRHHRLIKLPLQIRGDIPTAAHKDLSRTFSIYHRIHKFFRPQIELLERFHITMSGRLAEPKMTVEEMACALGVIEWLHLVRCSSKEWRQRNRELMQDIAN